MDSAAFDRFTTTLATSGTRRAMVSLGLGGVLAGFGHEIAPAKKKKNKKKGKGCPNGKKKCGKKCISKAGCCSYLDCQMGCSNQDCINGTCQCPPATIMHNGLCGYFIDCKSVGEPCTGNLECCGNCVFDVDANESRCGKSRYQCLIDNDCERGPCRGFLCLEAWGPLEEPCR